MSKDNAWMPLYIGDYLRDTGHLTTAEHGAYVLLLMQAWVRGGPLPAESERLRAVTKMDRQAWNRSKETLLAFFILASDGYRHKRVDRELATSQAIIEQRRAAGKASAEARSRQRNTNGSSTGVQRNGNGDANELAANGQQNGRPLPSPKESKILGEGKEAAGARETETNAIVRGLGKSLKTQPPPFTPSRDVQLSALTIVTEKREPHEPIRTPEEQLAILRGETAA